MTFSEGRAFVQKEVPVAGDPEVAAFLMKQEAERVDQPSYYGGADNPYEAIKVIEAWRLDFCLGNAVKYISRAGKKDPGKELEDLRKAAWYVQRRIEQLGGGSKP